MNFRKPTGLCFHCNRSTKLLVHQKCGKGRSDGKKLKQYDDRNIRGVLLKAGVS